MPKFAANIIYLFNEIELIDRIGAAAAAGFQAIECQRPYDVPAPVLCDAMADAGLEMVLINTPPCPHWPQESGIAIHAERTGAFRELADQALAYAADIDCPRMHVVAGRLVDGQSEEAATAVFADNITWAADLGRERGVRILIEPLNAQDNPGYFLTTAGQGRAIVDEVDHDNVYLQYDLYHAGVNGEDVIAGAREHLTVIDHMQMAGVPGRHEPDTGDIDMLAAFAAIDAMGYEGWIGAEYKPSTRTAESFAWGRPYGIGHGGHSVK